jgi:hypothetical protein
MGLKEQAKRMATGAAGVALATTGLSSCNDNGAVDPPPPPFQCSEVDMGQSLLATASLDGDTVRVNVLYSRTEITWFVSTIRSVTGATLERATLPNPGTGQQLLDLALALDTPATTQVSFAVESRFFGFGTQCPYVRVYTLTINNGNVQISEASGDELPLPARQQAHIAMVQQERGAVLLEAQTAYPTPGKFAWSVNAGLLDQQGARRVRWSLPPEPGFYAAELVVDFGTDGFAFDVLRVEVLPDHVSDSS